MPNLTTEQTHALQVYKDTGELGKSLENILIEHCLEELYKGSGAYQYMENKLSPIGYSLFRDNFTVQISNDIEEYTQHLKEYSEDFQIFFFQTLLSRTPDGKAVIHFLDVETRQFKNRYKKYILDPSFVFESASELINETPKTIDELLYREFTEALRVGKGLEEAHKIINQIYIDQCLT